MKESSISQSDDRIITERYQRAESLMSGYLSSSLVQNDRLHPFWIEGIQCFWYERSVLVSPGHTGKEFRVVDAEKGDNTLAFDHQTLSTALQQATGESFSSKSLPIDRVFMEWDAVTSSLSIFFSAFNKRWQFLQKEELCIPAIDTSPVFVEVPSPDGKSVAFSRDYNLWIRDQETGKERALTHDGIEGYAYGVRPSAVGITDMVPDWPALWSPDGTRLLVARRDFRKVKVTPHVHYIPKDGSVRPQLQNLRVAYTGDEDIETYKPLAIEVATGEICEPDYHPVPVGRHDCLGYFKVGRLAWWSSDGQLFYFLDLDRGDRALRLVECNVDSGSVRIVFEEVSETQINVVFSEANPPLHRILTASDELIWWSERSGWGHLYLYDLKSGCLKNAITRGEWVVRGVLFVDEKRREVFIQIAGRQPGVDPYYREICRVNIDTGEIVTLLSGNYDYSVQHTESVVELKLKFQKKYSAPLSGVSPCGTYVVATKSRVDYASRHILADREGNVINEFEKVNTALLPKDWKWPEPVKVLSADGKTELYGLIQRPSDFSPDRSYPVINFINSAPWAQTVPKSSFAATALYCDRHYFYGAAIAELGFIVVQLDSRGTPFRSKAFQDESYGWIPSSANTEDHEAVIRQLAEIYPYMDLDRVGVVSQAYRSGLQNFLERQEFYKACVQFSVLDDRLDSCVFYGDKYEGVDGPLPDKLFPEELVKNLEGKLCLMFSMNSMLAQFYNPAGGFRIVDALQEANKDFELLVVSNGDFVCSSYMFRRGFDFLVRELAGIEPPRQYSWGKLKVSSLVD